jgi:hypothetical protein
MAVRLFNLSSGEQIITDTDSEQIEVDGQRCLLINRPLQVLIMEQGIALKMWMPCDLSQPLNLRIDSIVADAVAPETFAREYLSRFSTTNIVAPPEPKLVVPG